MISDTWKDIQKVELEHSYEVEAVYLHEKRVQGD